MARAEMTLRDNEGNSTSFAVSNQRDDPDAADEMVRRLLHLAATWQQLGTPDET